jgi:hypothetical protein
LGRNGSTARSQAPSGATRLAASSFPVTGGSRRPGGGVEGRRGIEDPSERAKTLAALAAALPEGERGPVLAEAYAAADAVKYAFQRVEALATVALVLPEENREDSNPCYRRRPVATQTPVAGVGSLLIAS